MVNAWKENENEVHNMYIEGVAETFPMGDSKMPFPAEQLDPSGHPLKLMQLDSCL